MHDHRPGLRLGLGLGSKKENAKIIFNIFFFSK